MLVRGPLFSWINKNQQTCEENKFKFIISTVPSNGMVIGSHGDDQIWPNIYIYTYIYRLLTI